MPARLKATQRRPTINSDRSVERSSPPDPSENGAGNACRSLRNGDRSIPWLEQRSRLTDLIAVASATMLTDPSSAKAYLDCVIVILQEPLSNQPARSGLAARRGSLAYWQVRRLSDYVEANLSKPIRNADLAAIARLSTSHLCRVFKSTFARSPHEYILERRVERAKELLEKIGEPLSQIASSCGFADQAHLTRRFKSCVGETPVAWRRSRESGTRDG